MQNLILLTGFITAMAAFAYGQAPPPLTSPLLLKTKGAFIELRDGEYLRASAITNIEGIIVIEYKIDGKNAKPHQFPLSSESLEKIPTVKLAAKEKAAKITDIVARIEILVNGKAYIIANTNEKSPFDDFERFGESVVAGREHLEKLLQYLNRGEQPSGQPATNPVEKPKGSDKPLPESEGHSR